jgi:hypothetical protein
MRKNNKEQRHYSQEFKGEAAPPAGKKEKPVSRIAVDLGVGYYFYRKNRKDKNGFVCLLYLAIIMKHLYRRCLYYLASVINEGGFKENSKNRIKPHACYI